MDINYMKYTSVIVLNDSLCQCLTKYSKRNDSIMADFIANKLIISGYKDVIAIDSGSLSLNKQHNIYEFLKNNLSVEEIKATQIESIKSARKDLITKIGIPKWQEKYYKIDEKDKYIHISDAIKYSKNSGVVLSCVSNDLMSQMWVSPISYLISKIPFTDNNAVKRFDILLKYDYFFNNVIDGIKENIEQILGINNNSKICLLGIYRPNVIPKEYSFLIYKINEKLENVSREYNQSYIDINDISSRIIDFHPNLDNFKIISNRVSENLISRFSLDNQESNFKFDYSSFGINGAIDDLENYYEKELDTINNTINFLIYNGYDKEKIKIIMSDYINGRPKEIKEHINIYKNAKKLINERK